jgi:RNA polymerase sigma-70 factor (ECF subfamily)
MPDEPSDFAALLARARAGDQAALADLARQYEPEVRVVARVVLGPALRPYLDSLDVMQSVHRSLLLGLRQNRFEITSPQNLIALAATMVRRKVARHWRRLKRQQRLSLGGASDPDRPGLLSNLGSPEPDPAAEAQLNEALHHLAAHLDATEREVMRLRLDGHSTAEVARRLNLDPDVLRVRLSRLRQRLRAAGVLTEWL